MNKKMLVECDLHQTRIAILEQDRLAELFIERHEQLGVVGNIYQGRVNRVLPGMQAAFVDIGLERDALPLRQRGSRPASRPSTKSRHGRVIRTRPRTVA